MVNAKKLIDNNLITKLNYLKTNNLKDEEFDQLVEAKYEDIIADVEAGTVDLTQLLKDLLGDIDLLAYTKD